MTTTTLTPTQQVIFDTFRRRFDDLPSFDSLAAEPIRKSIVDLDTGDVVLDSVTVKSFTKKYISTWNLPSKAEKKLGVEVNHIICTLCVYMILRSRPPGTDIYSLAKIEELNEILLGWEAFDDIECNLLLTFHDVVKTAVELFPDSKSNKNRVLFIGHRLGGTDLRKGKHSTGGGQSKETSRRVRIYEFRSNAVQPTPGVLPALPNATVANQTTHVGAPSAVTPAQPTPSLTVTAVTPIAPLRRANKRPHQAVEVCPPVPDESQEAHEAYQKVLQAIAEYKAITARCVKKKSSAQPAPQPEDSAEVHKLMLPPASASTRQSSSAPSSDGFIDAPAPAPAPGSSTPSASAPQAHNYAANILTVPGTCSAEGWRRKTKGKGLAKLATLLQQAVSSITPPDGDHSSPVLKEYEDDPNFDMGDEEVQKLDWLQAAKGDGESTISDSWTVPSFSFLNYDAANTLISISGH